MLKKSLTRQELDTAYRVFYGIMQNECAYAIELMEDKGQPECVYAWYSKSQNIEESLEDDQPYFEQLKEKLYTEYQTSTDEA